MRLFREVGTLHSRTHAMSLVKTGAFTDDDVHGLHVSKPPQARPTAAAFDVPVVRSVEGAVLDWRNTVLLSPEGGQTNFELSCSAALAGSLSFGINLFYRRHLEHDPSASNAGFLSPPRLTL